MTGNQCSLVGAGRTWSCGERPSTTKAVAFCTSYKRLKVDWGRPYRTASQ